MIKSVAGKSANAFMAVAIAARAIVAFFSIGQVFMLATTGCAGIGRARIVVVARSGAGYAYSIPAGAISCARVINITRRSVRERVIEAFAAFFMADTNSVTALFRAGYSSAAKALAVSAEVVFCAGITVFASCAVGPITGHTITGIGIAMGTFPAWFCSGAIFYGGYFTYSV